MSAQPYLDSIDDEQPSPKLFDFHVWRMIIKFLLLPNCSFKSVKNFYFNKVKGHTALESYLLPYDERADVLLRAQQYSPKRKDVMNLEVKFQLDETNRRFFWYLKINSLQVYFKYSDIFIGDFCGTTPFDAMHLNRLFKFTNDEIRQLVNFYMRDVHAFPCISYLQKLQTYVDTNFRSLPAIDHVRVHELNEYLDHVPKIYGSIRYLMIHHLALGNFNIREIISLYRFLGENNWSKMLLEVHNMILHNNNITWDDDENTEYTAESTATLVDDFFLNDDETEAQIEN